MGQQKIIKCKVERLTNGPKHHLFGFHDLIISNMASEKYLSLEVDTINRPPLPGELFGVGYVKDGQFVRVGETTALNYPQGARQQWVSDTELFTVNNRVGSKWGTDLYDASTNQLIDRFEAPTHMLSKDGHYAYGLDYSRLFRLGGYGYNGILDNGDKEIAPEDSGITVMNLKNKEVKLLVSVRQAALCGTNRTFSQYGHHYLTHLSLNPDSSKIAFLHRYPLADGGEMTRLMTVDSDGSGLKCIAQGFLSHFDWKDNNHIYIFGRANSKLDTLRNNPILSIPILSASLRLAKKTVKSIIGKNTAIAASTNSFIMISVTENPQLKSFAKDIIPVDGHPMTCPTDNNWCINDTYPNGDGIRDLMLYNFEQNVRIDIGNFRMLNEKPDMTKADIYFYGVDPKILNLISRENLAFTRSGLHCDLHPRWNADGTKAVFDSIHEGTRQIYMVDVIGIKKMLNT